MSTADKHTAIIIGCGYLGRELSKLLNNPLGVVATQTSVNRLIQAGVSALRYNLDHPLEQNPLPSLAEREVYYFAPPSTVYNEDHRIDHFLTLCKEQIPRRIVYISTSGVYGDCHGAWVDETHPLNPITPRAKRRVYAEHAVQQFCAQSGCEYMILRVGGIYGADRLPVHRIPEIRVIDLAEAPFSNRMHVEDLAQACLAAMQCESKNEIINVGDGNPTSMTDYYNKVADFAGIDRPESVPLSEAEEKLSSAMLSFINESRRLSTNKMLTLLKFSLKWPTLELGLKHCFKKSCDDVNC